MQERERERPHKVFGRFRGCATRLTYIGYFYRHRGKGKFTGNFAGFPMQTGAWCKKLKYENKDIQKMLLSGLSEVNELEEERKDMGISVSENRSMVQQRFEDGGSKKFFKGSESEVVQYIGIAADEPERIARHIVKPNIILPLVEAGWEEDMCGLWCQLSGMLSPTYSHSYRDGCWFCHNQGVDQLRYLYKNYPYLWEKLLALDNDSPVTFHADGHTVHDFDKRFRFEDDGYCPTGKRFKWNDLENPQMNLFQFLDKDGG